MQLQTWGPVVPEGRVYKSHSLKPSVKYPLGGCSLGRASGIGWGVRRPVIGSPAAVAQQVSEGWLWKATRCWSAEGKPGHGLRRTHSSCTCLLRGWWPSGSGVFVCVCAHVRTAGGMRSRVRGVWAGWRLRLGSSTKQACHVLHHVLYDIIAIYHIIIPNRPAT